MVCCMISKITKNSFQNNIYIKIDKTQQKNNFDVTPIIHKVSCDKTQQLHHN